jgi:hypothetical protein
VVGVIVQGPWVGLASSLRSQSTTWLLAKSLSEVVMRGLLAGCLAAGADRLCWC